MTWYPNPSIAISVRHRMRGTQIRKDPRSRTVFLRPLNNILLNLDFVLISAEC